jgi:hypothetical protein
MANKTNMVTNKEHQMSNKIKALSLSIVYATSLTMGLSSTSFANCSDEIASKPTNLNFNSNIEETLAAVGLFGMATVVYAPAGIVSSAGLAVSSSIDKATALSDNERYALDVLVVGHRSGEAPRASFVKLVQKEVAKDHNAVIPTEEEIVRSIAYVDSSLLACRTEDDKFFKPTKQTLLKTVLKDLKIN